jgi:hypothetical protein
MMMSFICSCRNKKIGAELHIYLEEGTYHNQRPLEQEQDEQEAPRIHKYIRMYIHTHTHTHTGARGS